MECNDIHYTTFHTGVQIHNSKFAPHLKNLEFYTLPLLQFHDFCRTERYLSCYYAAQLVRHNMPV